MDVHEKGLARVLIQQLLHASRSPGIRVFQHWSQEPFLVGQVVTKDGGELVDVDPQLPGVLCVPHGQGLRLVHGLPELPA